LLHSLLTGGDGERPALHGDFSLNTANVVTFQALLERGLERIAPTHDLNAAQIAALARAGAAPHMEAIAYQHLPVFHTEHCVFCRFLSAGTSHRDCGHPCEKRRVALRDDKGRAHPVMADAGCRNTVFNAEAQEASAHMDEWLEAGIRHFRIEFVHQSGEQVSAVTRAFASYLAHRSTSLQLGRELRRVTPEGTTEGSLMVPAFPVLSS
jgi:putative protease